MTSAVDLIPSDPEGGVARCLCFKVPEGNHGIFHSLMHTWKVHSQDPESIFLGSTIVVLENEYFMIREKLKQHICALSKINRGRKQGFVCSVGPW